MAIRRMVALHHCPIGQAQYQISERAVPLVLSKIAMATMGHQWGRTHLSHDGLNPAHGKKINQNLNHIHPYFLKSFLSYDG